MPFPSNYLSIYWLTGRERTITISGTLSGGGKWALGTADSSVSSDGQFLKHTMSLTDCHAGADYDQYVNNGTWTGGPSPYLVKVSPFLRGTAINGGTSVLIEWGFKTLPIGEVVTGSRTRAVQPGSPNGVLGSASIYSMTMYPGGCLSLPTRMKSFPSVSAARSPLLPS